MPHGKDVDGGDYRSPFVCGLVSLRAAAENASERAGLTEVSRREDGKRHRNRLFRDRESERSPSMGHGE